MNVFGDGMMLQSEEGMTCLFTFISNTWSYSL